MIRPSALVSAYAGQLPVTLRNRTGHHVRDLRVYLKRSGRRIGYVRLSQTLRRNARATLKLSRALRARRYRLVVTGRASGCSRRGRDERSAAFALPPTPSSPGTAGGEGAPSPTAPPPAPAVVAPPQGPVVQLAKVDWSPSSPQAARSTSFAIPGIATGQLTCSRDTQWLRVYPYDRDRAATMDLWTYKDWSFGNEQAVREAFISPFTGPDFNEGLNKFTPTEHDSTGEFRGVISSRGGFQDPGGPGVAPTYVKLTWVWHFDPADAAQDRCYAQAALVTEGAGDDPRGGFARSLTLNWRGTANAGPRDVAAVDVPGLGRLTAVCRAEQRGAHRLLIEPRPGIRPTGTITVHEGSETHESNVAGPGPYAVELGPNAIVEGHFDNLGARPVAFVLSSRWKVNDPDGSQNACFMAGQARSDG